MKVLYINSFSGKLSTGRIVSGLAKTVTENGGEAFICYGRDTDISGTAEISENVNSKFSLYKHVILSRITDSQGKWSKSSTKKIISKIKEFKPDIVHLHNIHGYYLNYKMLTDFLKEAQIPAVWTLHDCWPMTGHCCHFMYVNCDGYLKNCGNCPGKKTYPISNFADNSAKNLADKRLAFSELPDTTLVTPSKWLADIAKSTFLSQYPVKVINNGISRDKFYPRDPERILKKFGIENKKIVLGVCNVWTRQKGLDDLSALASVLPSEYKVVLIGKNCDSDDGNILRIPYTEGLDELAEWYSAAHVFVNPTYEDNFPTVNLEALACGTPVIGYNVGGNCECIENGCGACVNEKSVQALANAVTSFNTTDEIRIRCRELSKKYDLSRMNNEYFELYKSLLKNKET